MRKGKTLLLLMALVLVCSTLLTFTLTSKKVISFDKRAETDRVDVKWNYGYVASSTHASSANQLVPNGMTYSYTDVIELGAKGTRVSFVDYKKGATSKNVYIVSCWKQVEGEWVLDIDRTLVIQENIFTEMSIDGMYYTYTSSYDNECIRLCYKSWQRSETPLTAYPTVYVYNE